ncbi:basic amino acid ABC transporter substrate-binding protein [Candidatus Parcubacteria bacterium]|nr:basic amino acid ABC transporter substrate-binding protein [Patescibacteria group bacterium]MBU4466855.1 basic amino acid ABC transporter substrate-binding protein [Patescibacteria group bacterium]MCG2688736.1 basic amino acid ABC transporter substrate-binding protein [Candidatus Parcubacteria bacterium]
MTKRTIILATIIIFILGGLGLILYGQFFSGNGNGQELGRLGEIKKRGEIIIGTDATYPPMESLDEQGNFSGMDIDIIKEIASDLGVEVKFKNVIWEEIFNAVKNGEVDVIISAITITQERTETLAFSDPYFNAGQVIVSTKDKEGVINRPEDLGGYRVGAQVGTTSEEEARKYTNDLSLVSAYENYDLAKEDLLEGKIDAIIIDYPAAVGMTAKDKGLQIMGDIFTQEFYGIAIQKDQQELLLQINKTIRRLKREGELKKIEEKWLSQ